jgi:hypothetical protein
MPRLAHAEADGGALTFLRMKNFFTEKEEKFSAGLSGLIGDEAIHSLIAEREYRRFREGQSEILAGDGLFRSDQKWALGHESLVLLPIFES